MIKFHYKPNTNKTVASFTHNTQKCFSNKELSCKIYNI